MSFSTSFLELKRQIVEIKSKLSAGFEKIPSIVLRYLSDDALHALSYMEKRVNSIFGTKERLTTLKIHSSLKDAGVSDDLTEFNSYIRLRSAELV